MTRDEAYRALSDLVGKGFTAVSAVVGDRPFVFKTVNEKEYRLIQMAAGPGSDKYSERFGSFFLAYSTLMVDGVLVLKDREGRIGALKDMYDALPKKVHDAAMEELGKARTAAYEAVSFLEGYTYTAGSRAAWRILGGRLPCEEAFTGVPGTGFIGLNSVQENWSYINRMLDQEESRHDNFSLAILVASSNNPKGAKTMRARHDASLEEAEGRRRKLAEAGKREDISKLWHPEGWAAPTDTAETLVAELNRQMEGKKDRHDLFIEKYMDDLKNAAALEAKKVEDRIREARDSGRPDFEGMQRPLTPAEAEELMRRGRIGSNEIRVKDEEHAGRADRDKFLSHLGSRILTGK